MREIKFRAWDIDKKEMFIPSMITSSGDISRPYGIDNWCKAELMQFTGLQDKNGKDIYEGDIVEYEDLALDGGGDGEKHIVCFESLEEAIMFNMGFKYVGSEQMEIIGNIYENPELLTN